MILYKGKSLLLEALMDGGGGSSRLFLLPWFDRLASIFSLIEDGGVWPDGLLDGFFSLILKV